MRSEVSKINTGFAFSDLGYFILNVTVSILTRLLVAHSDSLILDVRCTGSPSIRERLIRNGKMAKYGRINVDILNVDVFNVDR